MRGLDTYYGRKITSFGTDSDGRWFIELEGGIRVINVDGKRKAPKGLPNDGVGLRFSTLIMEPGATTLAFHDEAHGEWRIQLSPLSYQIFDAEQSEAPYAPQAGGYGSRGLVIDTPPEPVERLAEGPDNEDEEPALEEQE